MPMCELLQ